MVSLYLSLKLCMGEKPTKCFVISNHLTGYILEEHPVQCYLLSCIISYYFKVYLSKRQITYSHLHAYIKYKNHVYSFMHENRVTIVRYMYYDQTSKSVVFGVLKGL